MHAHAKQTSKQTNEHSHQTPNSALAFITTIKLLLSFFFCSHLILPCLIRVNIVFSILFVVYFCTHYPHCPFAQQLSTVSFTRHSCARQCSLLFVVIYYCYCLAHFLCVRLTWLLRMHTICASYVAMLPAKSVRYELRLGR